MIKSEVEEKTIAIGEVKALLEMGYKIEVDSPDGWVNVSDFVDKGEWEEYIFECNNKRVICNEKHLFETNIGWKNAQELLEIQNNNSNESSLRILCDDGNYHTYRVEKTGNIVPIVDIHVDHDNHRYYTNGISSHNTGVGKSLVMCHFASSYLSQGLNVLYITMEMAEERIAERIDANLLDTRIDQIKNLSESTFTTKLNEISKKTHGKLIIKEYPTASAHAGHFRALLNELSLKKNFKPDIIFIDYLNICASSRIKGLSGGVNTYSLVKAIAEELRGLAVENNVPIWTATQVNRQGASSSDMELTDTSESFGLPATADLFLALLSTEQLESMGQIMIKQLKNRYNDISKNKRFTVGLDRAKMRLYDIADPTANLINAASPTPVVSSPFASKSRKVNDFADFTVE